VRSLTEAYPRIIPRLGAPQLDAGPLAFLDVGRGRSGRLLAARGDGRLFDCLVSSRVAIRASCHERLTVSVTAENRTAPTYSADGDASHKIRPGLSIGRFTIRPLFLAMVVIPTLIAALYFCLIAAPIYVSEASFVVRSPSQPSPGALDSVLQGVGLGGGAGSTDAFVVHEYITSRTAVHDLERADNLRSKLARPVIDWVARYPRPFESESFESLFHAYSRFVMVGYNSQTGISTLRVKAFTAKDASDIANTLLDGGEAVINQLNDRAAADALAESHRRTTEAEARVVSAEAALTDFRNRERLIDPARSSLAGLDLVAKLEGQLAELRAQRSALAGAAPRSPQLIEQDRQISALESQLDTERSKIAGEDTSLAPTIGEYEQLTIERDFAVKELTEASLAAEGARLEVRRKRLYLERVVAPNTPDAARLPRRLYSTAMVLISCLLLYGTTSLVLAGLREHGQS